MPGSVMAGPFGQNVFPTSADSPAFWLYTSGTTGRATAAMHRHRAIELRELAAAALVQAVPS
jgi:acyl-coenzyme A synthetase/AMP-(fatty) acid ligase